MQYPVRRRSDSSHGDGEDDKGEDEEKKAEFGDVKTTAELLGEVEELSLQVSQMGRPLPVGRNLAAELEDDADDYDDDDEQGVAPGDRPPPDTQSDTERRYAEDDANCSSATNDWPTLSPRMSTNPSCQTTSRTSTRRAI
ncbi:unnamed protein product [Phytophthora fragariaefolia]|uniref:Unnamed protein product n=1 Tax=Phytophthora fragariaefolia TaxID=1490495 RepID=A0A9W6YNB0_9STRA|nr:unnamed protein product [Phytophthora fragariaefolia]